MLFRVMRIIAYLKIFDPLYHLPSKTEVVEYFAWILLLYYFAPNTRQTELLEYKSENFRIFFYRNHIFGILSLLSRIFNRKTFSTNLQRNAFIWLGNIKLFKHLHPERDLFSKFSLNWSAFYFINISSIINLEVLCFSCLYCLTNYPI